MTDGIDTSPDNKGIAAQRYATLFAEREPYLVRARRISKLTIPSLFREWGSTGITDDVVPWQSLGGYGVNNLAAKLVLAMFPPGITFINIEPSRKALKDLAQLPPDQRGQLRDLVDKGLANVEQEFIDACEEDGDRAAQFDAARHLIVGGNHGLHICDDGILESIPLEQYVTVRDRQGRLQEFIVEDPMAWETMPPDVQEIASKNGYGPREGAEGEHKGEISRSGSNWECKNPIWDPIKVYTHGKLIKGRWWIYTEVMGEEVPGSRHPYNKDVMPYMFLRMVALKKEHYGRSYCEDYEGDIQTYDALAQALTEGGTILARVITLVKAGGTTLKDAIIKARNGDVITGEEGEVHVLQANKGGDLSVVFQLSAKYEDRISKMFILNSALERPGERVTATEIQFKAQELDTTLGGVYSNQVVAWQKPYAQLKLHVMMKLGRVTPLPKGQTKITILTGDAALGRGKKAQDLIQFLQTMMEIFPQTFQSYVNLETAAQRAAANMQVDSDGLVKSEEEVQAAQQQAQAAALSQKVAPQVAQQGGQMLQNYQQAQIDQGQQQQQPQQPSQGDQ